MDYLGTYLGGLTLRQFDMVHTGHMVYGLYRGRG